MSQHTSTSPSQASSPAGAESTDAGLHRGLKNRHIQMIAIGGAIGTGLFYGVGSSIRTAGPAILVSYAIGGLVIFLVMRAMGEMSVEEPVSGAFAHYARRYWGDLPGFYSGWNYWFSFVAVSMAELTAIGHYINFWWPQVPTWASAAVFLVLVTGINLIDVRAFGEFEFWFSIIKVVAIIAMILFGLGIILFGIGSGTPTGFSNLTAHGGFFAQGPWGVISALAVVMFAFGGIELIGIAAGEADDPTRTIPKAINQVVHRICLFYIGSVFVMLCLVPWDKIAGQGSPFVTVFDTIGISSTATLLNIVVLTAALSAYNSGLYSNGRMLHTLAREGDAPRFLGKLGRSGVPTAGVLFSSTVTASVVALLAFFPKNVFEYVMAIALFAAVTNWCMITYTQVRYRKQLSAEEAAKLRFRMPFHPYSNYLVLAFFVALMGIMWTHDSFRPALIVGPLWAVGLITAYFVKSRIRPKATAGAETVAAPAAGPTSVTSTETAAEGAATR